MPRRVNREQSSRPSASEQEVASRVGSQWDVVVALVNVLPSIKKPLQLVGLIVTIVGLVIVQVVSPNNVPALLSAGMVGVGLILFATMLFLIKHIRESERAYFILVLFAMYVGATGYLVNLTYDFLTRGATEIGEEAFKNVDLAFRKKERSLIEAIKNKERELQEVQSRERQTQSLPGRESLREASETTARELDELRDELKGVRSESVDLAGRQQSLKRIAVALHDLRTQNANVPAMAVASAADSVSRGKVEKAEAVFKDRFKQLNDEASRLNEQRGRTALVLGEIAELKGDLRVAQQWFNTAYSLLPLDPVVLEDRGRILRLLGDFSGAADMFAKAASLASIDNSRRSWALVNLGIALWHEGKYEEAEKRFDEAYNGSQRRTLMRALAAESYGAFKWHRDQLDAAQALLQEADSAYDQLPERDQFLRFQTYNNLGGVLLAKGLYLKAIPMLKRALMAQEKTIGVECLQYAQTETNLLLAYSRYGTIHEAKQIAEKLRLAISQSIWTGYEAGQILSAVSEFYSAAGPLETAIDLLKESLSVLFAVQLGDRSARVHAVLKLTEAYLDAENPELARQLLDDNAELLLGGLREHSRDMARYRRIEGRFALASGDYARARERLEASLTTQQNLLGPIHPDQVSTIVQLAVVAAAEGNIKGVGKNLEVAEQIVSVSLDKASRAAMAVGVVRERYLVTANIKTEAGRE